MSSSSSSSSSTGGAGGSGGGGGGAGGCTIDAQCVVSGPCKTVACVDGTCVEGAAPPGPAAAGDMIGDCKHKECDGNGNVIEQVDDADIPQDYNVCTLDLCTNGLPSNPVDPANIGVSCGGGQTTCKNGKCSGCTTDAECPMGGPCDKPMCAPSKNCEFVVEVGKFISNPDPTDCLQNTCDAMGNVVAVAAPQEMAQPDANECDAEVCGANGIEHNAVPDGTTCGMPTQCHPLGCSNGACADLPFPGNETIASSQTLGDCKVDVCDGAGGITQITDDQDVPVDPSPGDCTIVKCMNGGVTMGAAPAGAACTQPNGLPGTCSATGVCS
jgi:hypothetical protein